MGGEEAGRCVTGGSPACWPARSVTLGNVRGQQRGTVDCNNLPPPRGANFLPRLAAGGRQVKGYLEFELICFPSWPMKAEVLINNGIFLQKKTVISVQYDT